MTTCGCGHDLRQHSRNGCTWEDPDGKNKCRCTTTYMELAPKPQKKK